MSIAGGDVLLNTGVTFPNTLGSAVMLLVLSRTETIVSFAPSGVCLLQVDTVLLNTDVTFPNTAGSAVAAAAAASLKTTLLSNPGQVYTASGAALLASAVVAISNVTQSTSLPVVAGPSQIPPGPAPVQFLLKENLVRPAVGLPLALLQPLLLCHSPGLRGQGHGQPTSGYWYCAVAATLSCRREQGAGIGSVACPKHLLGAKHLLSNSCLSCAVFAEK